MTWPSTEELEEEGWERVKACLGGAVECCECEEKMASMSFSS